MHGSIEKVMGNEALREDMSCPQDHEFALKVIVLKHSRLLPHLL